MNEALLNKLLNEELAKVDWERLARLFKARRWTYFQKGGGGLAVPAASRLRETVVELFSLSVSKLRSGDYGDTTWNSVGRFLVVVTATPGCHGVQVWMPAYAVAAAKQAKADERRGAE